MKQILTRAARPVRLALVASLALAPIGAQAGSLSLSLNARSAQEASALNTAIGLYALHRDITSGADVRQIGRNHAAGVYQSGGRSRGIIHQRGRNHTANLSQTGGNNGQVILQFGDGAHADVTQHGGQAGILLQFSQ